MGKSNAGRPKKITPEVVKKLEEAFLLGCTDAEACFFADISKQTLYTYQKENAEFLDRKERLKQNPVFKARKAVVDAVETDPDLAMKYLERKVKKEFSTRVESTGEDGGPQVIQIVRYGDNTDTE
ncbi:hypothetical protein [Kiloniella litopenaei]|uniref:hypothetical protein n=1 Tax=Kiloniella litopenaei TaxID=1549748 RepID=UPI003BAD17BF